ncbi:MAG: Helix-turn-helix domain [Thermoleophilia bacterium]|nr:Helix-turn-helix domain [Thermoleophilia bacterium]
MQAVIGDGLRARREHAGLTQFELGARITGGDDNDKYISRVERGLVNISATRVIELAHALGVPPGDLLADAADAYAADGGPSAT